MNNMYCSICTSNHNHHHDMNSRWIGVDFDGTISRDRDFRSSPYELGEPIPSMINRIKGWIAEGYTVKLLTARMNPVSHTGITRDIVKMEALLKQWCLKHIGTELECVMAKDGLMEVLWDDRAIQVVRDIGDPTHLFKPESVWTKTKPRVAGAYYVRGFSLNNKETKALVEVYSYKGKLVTNLHRENSQDDYYDWTPLFRLNDDFEWLGPLVLL